MRRTGTYIPSRMEMAERVPSGPGPNENIRKSSPRPIIQVAERKPTLPPTWPIGATIPKGEMGRGGASPGADNAQPGLAGFVAVQASEHQVNIDWPTRSDGGAVIPALGNDIAFCRREQPL